VFFDGIERYSRRYSPEAKEQKQIPPLRCGMEMQRLAGWDLCFPPIASARWMGHPSFFVVVEGKRIPPLRCGMEMQKGEG